MKHCSTSMFLTAVLYAFVSFPQLACSQSSDEITADELKVHLKYLASDELEGRGSGSEGNRKAAEYVTAQFKSYGLKPAGSNNSYFQEFEFVSAVKLGSKNSLTLSPAMELSTVLDEDYRPFGFTSNGEAKGEVVFAGYGISAAEKNYDDYAGIDVTGKIVIALRYGPDGNDIHSELYKFTSFRNKARVARDKGAAALIMVDPLDDDLVKLTYDQSFSSSGIPCVTMRRSILEKLLEVPKKDLSAISDTIKSRKQPESFAIPGVTITLQTEVEKVKAKTANVLGFIEGNDPALKDQVVIIGAHFDHLGYGGEGSGSLQPDVHEIHNGADDNASGSSALLEVTQKFGAHKNDVKRTLLFIGFSGEELGTLGSQYYTNNPFFPLKNTIAMLNMDMVGRMKDNSLSVQGVGTSPVWNDIVKKWNSDKDSMAIKTVADGFGPSDHASFFTKDIPVLFFFTGNHSDYHKPSDDWDKINYPDEERVARYVYNIANDLQGRQETPTFTKTQSAMSTAGGGDGRGFTVTLGVVPDYGATVEGLRIDGTRAGGPAEKAGLKAGDIITKLAGKNVLNIYDYMGVLGELKVGDVVNIQVKRDGKPMTFSATMTKR